MKKASLLIILFLLFLFVTSCKKHVENKIDGKWKRVNVVNATSDTFEDWEFSDGYFDILSYSVNGTIIDTLCYTPGKYTIKMKLFKRILVLSNLYNSTCNPYASSYNGDWTIEKLTKKYLTFYRNNPGMEYREFTKE